MPNSTKWISWIKYSNCFFGAILLRLCIPGKIVLGHRPNSRVPHWMVRSGDGYYHFRVTKDLFWWPLNYLLFRGQFEFVTEEDMKRYYSYEVRG